MKINNWENIYNLKAMKLINIDKLYFYQNFYSVD